MALPTEQRRHHERVISGRHQSGFRSEEVGRSASFVDGKIVDHRFHCKRQRGLQFLLALGHDFQQASLCQRPLFGGKNKAHSAPGHAAQHPKSPKRIAELGTDTLNQTFCEVVRSPRDDGLNGLLKIPCRGTTDSLHITLSERAQDLTENTQHAFARHPFRRGTQQVLFGNHFQNGTDILSHAAVHQDEAFLQSAASVRGGILVTENAVLGHEPSTANPKFRIAVGGRHAFYQFHPRPNPSGVLPTASRTP